MFVTRWWGLFTAVTLAGCSTIYHPDNQPISEIDTSGGYRRISIDRQNELGDSLLLLAFSGGGTRAAALSYGVMKELRDTLVPDEGGANRLLDEVDTISSVSGGSFTAAYYGVFREKLFEDYERDFLRQDVQSTLVRKLFNPGYWFSSLFSGFDRTEMAIDYYDRTIFKGATFADMGAMGPPFVDINATDLTTGMRFTFNQDLFDFFCSDLSNLRVARAVTASSAVPVAFPTIVLKNYADRCDIAGTRQWALLESVSAESQSGIQLQLAEDLRSYRDVERRRYIHLVDGGISDNLGLRAIIDRVEALGDERFQRLSTSDVKNVLIVLVNAAVKRDNFIEQSPKKPKPATTMSAFIDSQIKRYDEETVDRMRENVRKYQRRADSEGLQVRFYFADVSFDDVQVAETRSILNSMPTSLELSNDAVDKLIVAGRLLLRSDSEFQRFKNDNNARLDEEAPDEKAMCKVFGRSECLGLGTVRPAALE